MREVCVIRYVFAKMRQFYIMTDDYLAENMNKKAYLLNKIIEKVGSEEELNPGLLRERPETKPLCHRGIHYKL